MNRRAMKQTVCQEAALVIENAIDSGWEFGQGMTEADAGRYEAALWELILELRRRGGDRPDLTSD